jgi:ABC-type transporter Mla subunit MlaD
MNERQLGYCIIAFLAIFVSICSVYFIWATRAIGEPFVISFNRIGNLKIDDPVKLRGVDIGTVEEIADKGTRIMVTVKTRKKASIYRNYRIICADKGLMGDRLVVIDGGTPSAGLIRSGDTLVGEFAIGVSEAIGLAYRLRDIVDTYKQLTEQLLHETDRQPAFTERFNSFVHTFDSLSLALYDMAHTADREFGQKLEEFRVFVERTESFSRSVETLAPKYATELENTFVTFDTYLEKMDSLLSALDRHIRQISSADNALWRNDIAELQKKLKGLDEGVNRLRVEFIKLRLVFSGT